jgi:hypothetical protein
MHIGRKTLWNESVLSSVGSSTVTQQAMIMGLKISKFGVKVFPNNVEL